MTTFEVNIHQFIKATQTLTYNVTCDAKDLDSIKEQLLEQLHQDGYTDVEGAELVNTYFDDIDSDKSASYPTIIEPVNILK